MGFQEEREAFTKSRVFINEDVDDLCSAFFPRKEGPVSQRATEQTADGPQREPAASSQAGVILGQLATDWVSKTLRYILKEGMDVDGWTFMMPSP